MNDIISGIYKITNKINGKIYIGQSQNIFQRWADHRYESKSNTKPLYKAMRKCGIENFTFEIIEECDCSQLNEREIYWTKYFQSYSNGYNLTPGGDCSSKTQRIVSEQDVIQIRKRRLQAESFSTVYKDYSSRIKEPTFKKIWLGMSYNDIYVEGFTKENLDKIKIKTRRLESANRKGSKLTEDIVKQIRLDKQNGMKRQQAYQKYNEYFNSLSGFDGIWYNKRWVDIQP